MKENTIIAYLAPEIPALSSTFVYQEILQLEELGHQIKPISIHRPVERAHSNALESLGKRTLYLYENPFLKIVSLNIFVLITHPIRYFSTLRTALSDAVSVGTFSHTGKGLLFRFFIAASLVDYIRRENINHIHSNFGHIPTDIAMYAASITGVTFSFTSHANDLFERGWLLKEKSDRAHFAVTISEYNKRFLVEKGADKEKINIIHCGVDLENFDTRGEKQLSKPPRIGTLGRIVEKKGFDVLLMACNILSKDGVNFELQIAGDGPMKSEIEKLSEQLGLEESVSFLGAISHDNVSEWLKSLDIFVLPCKEDMHGDMDGIPVVLMEAMLSGVPVVSSRISGIPELIIDGITGLLGTQNDPVSLAENINKILSNIPLRTKVSKSAILKVTSDFDLKKNVKQFSTLIASKKVSVG